MAGILSRATAGALVAGAAMFGPIQNAWATLIGDSVVFELTLDGSVNAFGPTPAVVGAGVEYDLFELTVDVDALSIQVDIVLPATGAPQLDWIFTDLDLGGGDVILDAILTVFDGPAASFSIQHSANAITVSNVAFVEDIGAGPFFRVDIVTSAVPEPATLAVVGTGLAALGLWRRRRAVRALPTGRAPS